MRAALESIVEELKRLRAEGHRSIYLHEDTLGLLHKRATSAPPSRPQRDVAAASASEKADPDVSISTEAAPDARPKPHGRPGRRGVDPALKEFLEEATQGSAQPARERAAAAKVSKRPRGLPAGFEIAPIPEAPEISLPEGNRESQWNWLRERVLNCPVCREHVKPGKQIVFGTGHLEADIFFCGEAPGAEEENHGEPFVGRAGELLNKIITAMGLTRAEVYIGNIMNWRPETPSPSGNRPPSDEELAFCLPFLRAQIEIVRPRVIVALGSTAVTGLLGPDPKRRMGRMRGTWQSFEGTPLMVTYHPSYVLRQDTKVIKRQIWEDMLQVMEHVGLKISDKQRRYFN